MGGFVLPVVALEHPTIKLDVNLSDTIKDVTRMLE